MKTVDLEFPLPHELIAQVPAKRRDESRLLIYDRASGDITHTVFRGIPRFLPERCRLFRNNATVFKARLAGRRAGGGEVECLLLEPNGSEGTFSCLLRPGKRLEPGKSFTIGETIEAKVLGRDPEGVFTVKFFRGETQVDAMTLAAEHGSMPLPPYIRRQKGHDERLDSLDPERYQTVYAHPLQKVAAAAPTAGLHFTPELIDVLIQRGADFHDLTLSVGLGTFQPISSDTLEDHRMHEEFYTIPAKSVGFLRNPGNRPRVMVGTTSVRSCEDFMLKCPPERAGDWSARSRLFIKPPYDFQATDHLITNFHLPRSTLLCLVAAFLDPGGENGLDTLKRLYAEAVKERYRFFSYGDSMLIL